MTASPGARLIRHYTLPRSGTWQDWARPDGKWVSVQVRDAADRRLLTRAEARAVAVVKLYARRGR